MDLRGVYFERVDTSKEATRYRAAIRVGAAPSQLEELAASIVRHAAGCPQLTWAVVLSVGCLVVAFAAFLIYVFVRSSSAGVWRVPLMVVPDSPLLVSVFMMTSIVSRVI